MLSNYRPGSSLSVSAGVSFSYNHPAGVAKAIKGKVKGKKLLPRLEFSSIDIKSTPDGADITVDDKYVGTTPSMLKLPAGDHKIKLEMTGYKAWEKP